jgi:hypothetical protein
LSLSQNTFQKTLKKFFRQKKMFFAAKKNDKCQKLSEQNASFLTEVSSTNDWKLKAALHRCVVASFVGEADVDRATRRQPNHLSRARIILA